jgi:hypothetical protein
VTFGSSGAKIDRERKREREKERKRGPEKLMTMTTLAPT